MVSLSDETNRSGGYFFEDNTPSIQSRDVDDPLTESSTLSLLANSDNKPQKINTAWVIVIHIILIVLMWTSVFVLPAVCDKSLCNMEPYIIILYVVGSGWFVTLLLDRYYRYQHYYSRIYGYLEFYRKTRNIRRLPLVIYSAQTTVLLIASLVIVEKCRTSVENRCGQLSRASIVQIIVSLSSAMQVILLGVYFARTVSFNKSGASPDVNQEEMVTSFLHTNSGSTEVGFRDETVLDQVLERQADMIRYLKNSNTQLGKRILVLTEENKKLKART